MAKADDITSEIDWIWLRWDEAVERAGSIEKLLPHLRERRILARHNGLHYWPGTEERDGPGKIDPDWWANARVDPATKRVIFLMPPKYQMFIVGDSASPAVGPEITDEVFAFGIELGRGDVEALFPPAGGAARAHQRQAKQQSSKSLLTEEVKRRVAAGERYDNITSLSKSLHEWMKTVTGRPLKARSIENRLRDWGLRPLPPTK